MLYRYRLILIVVLIFFVQTFSFGQTRAYPQIMDDHLAITGDSCNWEGEAVHTLSIVEANLGGYRFWGYYGLDHYEDDVHFRKVGIVRSNDLKDWTKYAANPIVAANSRWPVVIMDGGIFYMFYEEYKAPNSDSRIVMLKSKNGIDFEDKSVVVPYHDGEQNQNPFIYFNKNDGAFYLFYYNGTERSQTNKRWSIYVKKSNTLKGLASQKPYEVITSNRTLAAPSVAYYNNTYYLLVEQYSDSERNSWVTNAFQSKMIDRNFEKVSNNPVLSDNDACAFQYVFDNQLLATYSHSIDLSKGKWVMRIFKAR